MGGKRRKAFRNLSIHGKMLAIVVPLIAIPMLTLATVGFVVASREAAKTSTRYLKQRENDLRTLAEHPAIRDYYYNTMYGPDRRSRGLPPRTRPFPAALCRAQQQHRADLHPGALRRPPWLRSRQDSLRAGESCPRA
ncbi:MAG: hypothetical protein KatS3mg131_2800 [Candidatus Tectimicrobiota bacterium]|nr:MAG: hypothetical protein KatS3mg131_2800 [Candidatus Tectomicrobia bacterium]